MDIITTVFDAKGAMARREDAQLELQKRGYTRAQGRRSIGQAIRYGYLAKCNGRLLVCIRDPH